MKGIIVYFAVLVVGVLVPNTSAQGMNLLRSYFKQYFTNFQPTTIRSYTLYGNGQNQPADYQASLPFPYDHKGKVNRLIYPASSKTADKKLLYDQAEVDISNVRPIHDLHNTEEYVKVHPTHLSQMPQTMFRSDFQAQKRSDDQFIVPLLKLKHPAAPGLTQKQVNKDIKLNSFIPFDKYETSASNVNAGATSEKDLLPLKSTKKE